MLHYLFMNIFSSDDGCVTIMEISNKSQDADKNHIDSEDNIPAVDNNF